MPQQDSDLWFFPRGWGYRRDAVDQYRQYAGGRIRELEGQVQALQQQVAEMRTAARGREEIADAVVLLGETRARVHREAEDILEAARREARAIREGAQAEADAVRHEIAAAAARDTARLQAFQQAVQETFARARGIFEAGLALVERAGGRSDETRPTLETTEPDRGRPSPGDDGASELLNSPRGLWGGQDPLGGWPTGTGGVSAVDAPPGPQATGDLRWHPGGSAESQVNGESTPSWPSAHLPPGCAADSQGSEGESQGAGAGGVAEAPATIDAGHPAAPAPQGGAQQAILSIGDGQPAMAVGTEGGPEEPPAGEAAAGSADPQPASQGLPVDAPLDGPPLLDDAPHVGGPGLRRRP